MILVDSSVWIDFFRNTSNRQTNQLVSWLKSEKADVEIGIADLVVFEVLRGFIRPKEQARAKDLLLTLNIVVIGGLQNALLAAEHYNALRAQGFNIASSIDMLLASYCITHGHSLLHREADFEAIETLRGLKTWPH